MPGRFMNESIFCIQFSPVIRIPGFTSGKKPQKVKKMLTCWPLAAADEARMVVAHVRSRSPLSQMMSSSPVFFGVSVIGSSIGSSSSVGTGSSRPSIRSGGRYCSGLVMVVVMADASLSPEDEAVDAVLDRFIDELVAGGARPGREVLGGTRVGGKHLDQLAGVNGLDGDGGPHDRQRAGEAPRVDALGDGKGGHRFVPQMKTTCPSPAAIQKAATPSTPSTSGSRSSGLSSRRSMEREQASISTSPSSLAWRSVTCQGSWPAAASAATAAWPSGPASGASPWSCSMRSRRKASRAQYCR